MSIIKHKIFDDKYFRSNSSHFNKLKKRNCEKAFEIWRGAKKELDGEYKDFISVIKKLGSVHSPSKLRQQKLLKELRRSLKVFSMAVYACKEKAKNFLNCYISADKDELSETLYDSIIEKLFWTTYIRFFIKLHTSTKHSGIFKILAFDFKEGGKDFYIINFSIKEKEGCIGLLLDGADIVYYAKKAMSYINDAEEQIFHYMVRRS